MQRNICCQNDQAQKKIWWDSCMMEHISNVGVILWVWLTPRSSVCDKTLVTLPWPRLSLSITRLSQARLLLCCTDPQCEHHHRRCSHRLELDAWAHRKRTPNAGPVHQGLLVLRPLVLGKECCWSLLLGRVLRLTWSLLVTAQHMRDACKLLHQSTLPA